MREILFRGKSVSDNKWVYGTVEFHLVDGDLTQTKKDAFITYDSMDKIGEVYRDRYEVVLATVGQFTGLTDKNGVKIFEGDIVNDGYGKRTVVFGNIGYDSSWNGLTGFGFKEDFNEGFYELCYWNDPLAYAVVGNVYDGLEMSTK